MPIDVQNLEGIVKNLVAHYGWIVLVLFVASFFKSMLNGFIVSLGVFFGNDINNEDIIYISGRQARVVRVGMRKTIFYMSDRGTKMMVSNDQLSQLTIEKRLPKNGNETYLPKKYELDIREGYSEKENK